MIKTLLSENCFYIFVILIFGFIFFEIVFNLIYFFSHKTWYFKNRGYYCFSSKLGYAHRKNLSIIKKRNKKNEKDSGEIHYHTGKYGFSWLYGLSVNSRKIFFIGDSFTESTHFDKPNSFTGEIWKQFEGQYTVINAGIGGGRMIHIRKIFEEYYKFLKSDLTFIQLSHNDFYDNVLGLTDFNNIYSHRLSPSLPKNIIDNFCSYTIMGNKFFSNLRTKRKNYTLKEKVSLLKKANQNEEWLQNIINECNLIKKINNSAKIFFYIPPSPFLNFLDKKQKQCIVDSIGMENIEAYGVFVEAFNKLLESRVIFNENNIHLTEFQSELQAIPIQQISDLFIDRSHLSKKGHRWFAKKLLQEFIVNK
jgi:lysophospholipase L1-like esterase